MFILFVYMNTSVYTIYRCLPNIFNMKYGVIHAFREGMTIETVVLAVDRRKFLKVRSRNQILYKSFVRRTIIIS